METITNITFAQLQTLHEVSRKINSQLDLQMLLDEIMDLAIELLQAEKGLILFRNLETGEMESQVARAIDGKALNNFIAMSRTVIEKVANDGESVFYARVPEPAPGDAGGSIHRYKIKSVLCVPLRTREKLIGVIYLDTTSPDYFFKDDDVFFLEAFANLAGVAIENARSYQQAEDLTRNLEKIVDERTRKLNVKHAELQKAYRELKDAQLQLVRSEKMASLGMLVAGIAHEVNTPLGAIYSNNDTYLRSFKKLRERVSALESDSMAELQPEIEKTLVTLERIADINNEACIRLMDIVKGLKNFARLDEEDLKVVNIHDGIDSTLDIVTYLCEGRVEIIKEYSPLPNLRCRPGQLNQVFMNLIVNASQAIEGKGKIYIKSYQKDDAIYVSIRDTGSGIRKENLEKIFDPGFTTKGVGVGTGLGLSIAFKVVEDHGGSIDVESKPGEGSTFTIKLPLDAQLDS